MKTPPNYEEMIKAIAAAALKYGFHYKNDILTDDCSQIETGHIFKVSVRLEMAEDGHITIIP